MYTPCRRPGESRPTPEEAGESERGARDRGRWEEMRRRAESDKGEKEGEICRPVGLFDFTCSYVIEYYTRPPRWKG